MHHRMAGGDRAPFRPLDIGRVLNVDGEPGHVIGCVTARCASPGRCGVVCEPTYRKQPPARSRASCVSTGHSKAQLQQHDTQVGILTEQYAHITEDYKTLAALLAQG